MLLFLAHRDIVYQRVITCSLGKDTLHRGGSLRQQGFLVYRTISTSYCVTKLTMSASLPPFIRLRMHQTNHTWIKI